MTGQQFLELFGPFVIFDRDYTEIGEGMKLDAMAPRFCMLSIFDRHDVRFTVSEGVVHCWIPSNAFSIGDN